MDHNTTGAIRMIDNADEKSIGVTAFKSRCLALIDEVAQGRTRRIVLVKRNQPVAAVVPLEQEPTADPWRSLCCSTPALQSG
jgi:antitoxin (DNA-binding transcriptional repressor) of toxin-antitoxin stability system